MDLKVLDLPENGAEPVHAEMQGNAVAIVATDYDFNAIRNVYGVIPDLSMNRPRGRSIPAIEGSTIRLGPEDVFDSVHLNPKTTIAQNSGSSAITKSNTTYYDTLNSLSLYIATWDHRHESFDTDAIRYPGLTGAFLFDDRTLTSGEVHTLVLGQKWPHKPYRIEALNIGKKFAEEWALRARVSLWDYHLGSATPEGAEVERIDEKVFDIGVDHDLSDLKIGDSIFPPYTAPSIELENLSGSSHELYTEWRLTPYG